MPSNKTPETVVAILLQSLQKKYNSKLTQVKVEMLATCVLILIITYCVYKYLWQNHDISSDEIRENHFNRKANWLQAPFDIGLKKPIGKWIYQPSKEIGMYFLI